MSAGKAPIPLLRFLVGVSFRSSRCVPNSGSPTSTVEPGPGGQTQGVVVCCHSSSESLETRVKSFANQLIGAEYNNKLNVSALALPFPSHPCAVTPSCAASSSGRSSVKLSVKLSARAVPNRNMQIRNLLSIREDMRWDLWYATKTSPRSADFAYISSVRIIRVQQACMLHLCSSISTGGQMEEGHMLTQKRPLGQKIPGKVLCCNKIFFFHLYEVSSIRTSRQAEHATEAVRQRLCLDQVHQINKGKTSYSYTSHARIE